MDHQAAKQYGRHCVSGNAEGQQRYQRTADRRIVSCLRGNNAIDDACTEFFGVLALLLGYAIGYYIRCAPPIPGKMPIPILMRAERRKLPI